MHFYLQRFLDCSISHCSGFNGFVTRQSDTVWRTYICGSRVIHTGSEWEANIRTYQTRVCWSTSIQVRCDYFSPFSLNLTTSLQLQDEINSQSLDHLCCYVNKFQELVKNQPCKTILQFIIVPSMNLFPYSHTSTTTCNQSGRPIDSPQENLLYSEI